MLLTRDTPCVKDISQAPRNAPVEALQAVEYKSGMLTSKLMLNGSPFADLSGVSKETVNALVELMQNHLSQ